MKTIFFRKLNAERTDAIQGNGFFCQYIFSIDAISTNEKSIRVPGNPAVFLPFYESDDTLLAALNLFTGQ